MIYKGCCKKMIQLKNTGSNIFDEAYFIISDKSDKADKMSAYDMVNEANKILSENMLSDYFSKDNKNKKKGTAGRAIVYLLGFLTGCALTAGRALILK